ncbi:TetR family transcriptional regulator [Actinomycetes bacterium KLBMP 9797]
MKSPGLRERKKQKTRWSIQEHALRLFQEQGYDQTTVDQIAAAAEVSPSTFFRYFKTKEDVVLQDEYDPIFEELLVTAPQELAPVATVRYALRTALASFDETEVAKVIQRTNLMTGVPAVRMRLLDNLVGALDVLAAAAASRTGRQPESTWARAFAGACVGAMLSAMFAWSASDRSTDFIDELDQALAELESGFA